MPDVLRLRQSPIVRSRFDHDDDIRITIRKALDHQSNHLYDLWVNDNHFILKEYLKQEEWAEAPLREYQGLGLAAELDIAPRPVTMMEATSAYSPIVIYEYLEGAMWDRRPPTPAELEQLADMWIRMNGVQSDGLWLSRGTGENLLAIFERLRDRYVTYLEWAQTNFPAAVPAAQDCLDLMGARRPVVEQLAHLSPVMCFCRAVRATGWLAHQHHGAECQAATPVGARQGVAGRADHRPVRCAHCDRIFSCRRLMGRRSNTDLGPSRLSAVGPKIRARF